MLVTSSTAEAVNIDASRSSTVAVVNGPVAADQEPRVRGAAQDSPTSPDALHMITAAVASRARAHIEHTDDRR